MVWSMWTLGPGAVRGLLAMAARLSVVQNMEWLAFFGVV
jgi:hypothetical protein